VGEGIRRFGPWVLLTSIFSLSLAASAAELDSHVDVLKKQLPSKEFTIVVQPPFVVIGDEPADVVAMRATKTVKWAVDFLKKDYFTKEPAEIINVWLFRDKASYDKHVPEVFGEAPVSPFGYYSPTHQALIMNIGTGGGTLVHEIVHPFVRANFPDCPAWFNEGLGSLYEQCREKDGHIWGATNWRLPALQADIAKRSVLTFAALTSLSDRAFYANKQSDYAQARYLCYYLQERGLLVKFYREFLANHVKDPTGYETLKAVLGNPDMEKFQREWEQFILKLTFP